MCNIFSGLTYDIVTLDFEEETQCLLILVELHQRFKRHLVPILVLLLAVSAVDLLLS